MSSRTPLLNAKDITKLFPGVRALNRINLEVYPGEALGLVGENGSGKSTLIKILSGVHPHGSFEGTFTLDGSPCEFQRPRQARNHGISIIHQELSVFPSMSVADNLFLTSEPLSIPALGWINEAEKIQQAKKLLGNFGVNIDVRQPIKHYSVAIQQIVEITKAIHGKAKLLILDEPTSALTERDTEKLLLTLKKLKSEGVALIYISHKLEEIFELTDRIVVLRDGEHVGSFQTGEVSRNQLVACMVGRKIENIYPPKRLLTATSDAPPVLRVTGATGISAKNGRCEVNDASLEVHAGEIVGLAGLMGSGRSELLSLIFGAYTGERRGQIEVDGKPTTIDAPLNAIHQGLAFLTEDRKSTGLLLDQSIENNMLLVSLKKFERLGILDRARGLLTVNDYRGKLRIKMTSPATLVRTLSGGNQQKILIARWLLSQPKILFLDEPTRGIDIGAKMEIYHLMDELARQGLAILMASSELPEIIGMSDRVYVMNEGRIVDHVTGQRVTQEVIMHAAVGLKQPSTRGADFNQVEIQP